METGHATDEPAEGASEMRLTWEGKPPVERPSEALVRRRLLRKRGGDTSYVILEAPDGSYVQMLGGGVACCLEWRDMTSGRHYRAYVDPPKVPWRHESKVGDMTLAPGEHLFIEDVAVAFCAFLLHQPFPSNIYWRNITEELAAYDIART